MQEKVPLPLRLEQLKSVDLYENSVAELRQHYTYGTFSTTDYVQYYVDRIRVVNTRTLLSLVCNPHNKIDPYLEAVIEFSPDALDIATQLDEERRRGQVRGSLHGIPVLVKNVCLLDKRFL